MEFGVGKDVLAGLEADRRARLFRLAAMLERRKRFALAVDLLMNLAIAVDGEIAPSPTMR